jgi:Copine
MSSHPRSDFSLLSISSDDDEGEETIRLEPLPRSFRLRLQASNLPVAGVFRGKAAPDSYAVVTARSNPSPANPTSAAAVQTNSTSSFGDTAAPEVIWGQTEVVCKSRDPHWIRTVEFEHVTGSNTFFYVHVFAHHGSEAASPKNDPKCLGTALFQVDDLLSTKNSTRCKRLRNGGCLYCQIEPVCDKSNPSKTVELQFQASNLLVPRKHVFRSKCLDTVLEIVKHVDQRGWIVVHRSAPVEDSLNPLYDEISLNMEDLCGSSLDRHIRLYVYAVNGNGRKRSLIGLSETTVWHMLRSSSERTLALGATHTSSDRLEINETAPLRSVELLLQRSSKKLKEVGRIHVRKAKILPVYSSRDLTQSPDSVVEIVDLTKLTPLAVPSLMTRPKSFSFYLQQGCHIDFCVAIDFTSSNGDPAKEESLHFQNEETLNDYEETISTIGQALAQYSDSDQHAVWGFGAKYGNVVRHIFQCGPTPTVTGVDGILAAYRSVFQSDLTMSGPTDFTQVLQAAAARAKRHHDNIHDSICYTVLLVITDGIMHDFETTRQRLDFYSTMPLSVLFVGVGRSDFARMHQMCQDSGRNTTFVAFRQHQHDPTALGKEALRNIPLQLCRYMQRQGI